MSSSGIISSNNGKIFDDLLPNPYPYPAQAPPLAQVLIAGQEAGNQDITNLNQLEVSNIIQAQAIGGSLTIGGAGGDLRIEGATDKGNILAGDGTSTVGLPVGANGLVLTTNSATATGLEWAVGGGGGGVASVSAGNNIAVSGTLSNPIVAVASPLNATLNLGTQNTTGTTGALTYDDTVANSKGVLGAISLILSDSTFATGDQTQTNKSGYSAIGSTDTTTHTKTGLSKTAGATALTLSNSVASQNIALNTASGIITTNCSIKPTAIRDSASSDGTSGQVLTAGTGGQLLWGANGVSSITAGSNIGITGTSTAPVVGVLNPLTSTLNLGTQSITGSTSNITLSSGTQQANMNGNLGFTSSVQATPTTKANLFNTSITIETSTNKVDIRPTQIVKTGSTTFTIQNSSAPLSLSGNGAGPDGVQIQQSANTATALTTSLSNIKYYPDYYLSNQNLNTVSVPLPQVDYQRLTLNNLGLTNTNSWVDYGGAIFSGYTAFGRDSNGNIWLADSTGSIKVCDSTITNILHNLSVSGGTAKVNVFYSQGGFMYIGGNFSAVIDVNGVNATPQFSITRVELTTYLFDPIYDGAGNVYGVQSGTDVFAIHDIAGSLGIGGNFTQKSNGSFPFSSIGAISNPYAIGGSQFYNEFQGGADARVYAIYYDSGNGRTYIGGDFTNVGISTSTTPANYCAYYDFNFSGWFQVANNQINNSVYTIKPTSYSQILLTGVFNTSMGISNDYSVYIDNTTPNTFSDTTFSFGGLQPTYKQGYYSGSYNAVIGFDNTFYISNAYQVWTSLGQTGAGSITGIDDWNGSYKVIGDAYNFIRSHSILPHSCIFTGSFVYDGTAYGNYTITTRNVSQQFIGDDANSFWSIIGAGVGTFS